MKLYIKTPRLMIRTMYRSGDEQQIKKNNCCLPYTVLLYFGIMRGSRSTAKLLMEFLANTLFPFMKKVCTPPYCCVLLLDLRLLWYF